MGIEDIKEEVRGLGQHVMGLHTTHTQTYSIVDAVPNETGLEICVY